MKCWHQNNQAEAKAKFFLIGFKKFTVVHTANSVDGHAKGAFSFIISCD